MQNGQQPPMPNFNLNDTIDIPCECGNLIFMQGMRFKKVSRLITGETKDSIIPIEVFLCTQCGKPLQELMPDELKDKKVIE